jgi:predicted nucleic acid-binding protein
VAAAIRRDPDHEACVAFFEQVSEPFVIPQLVITEAAHLVGRILNASAAVSLIRQLADAVVSFHCNDPRDLHRMAELMDAYTDLPLGTVDAAVIATAERLGVTKIATLDRRHFIVVRPTHVASFELLP